MIVCNYTRKKKFSESKGEEIKISLLSTNLKIISPEREFMQIRKNTIDKEKQMFNIYFVFLSWKYSSELVVTFCFKNLLLSFVIRYAR
jgi:hypothetical protein